MKKILFIVTECESANGICCKAVMDELIKRGDKVFCVTNKEYGAKNTLQDSVQFFYVKPRFVYRISSFLKHGSPAPAVRKALGILFVLINKLKLVLSYFSWPLISPLYSHRIWKLCQKIVNQNEIDTIIPVYTQIDTLIAAHRIKKQNPNICYVPYFLDSFSGGYGPKIFSKEWAVRRGIKWEKKLLPSADKIIMMQSSREHYEKYCSSFDYFKKIVFLDLPLFVPGENLKSDSIKWRFDNNKINFLFIGTIPAHIRPIEYFMELFSSLSDDRLCLTIVGSSTCAKYLENAAKKDPRIVLLPFVPRDEALLAMQSADFLVNFGNNNTHMTPSKIFEYMSLGKPIVSTAPIKDEPSVRYLEQYPAKYIVDYSGDMEEQRETLKSFIDEMHKKQYDVNNLEKVFYLNTPKAFADCLR